MARKEETFSIQNTLKKGNSVMVGLPFFDIKEDILGKNWNISLVFIGDKKAKTLNKKYRGKNYSANVLSFPLSPNEGEVFINLRKVERECVKFNMSDKKFTVFLFIHALLHLKGMEHGSRMEKMEQKYLKRFDLD